MSDPSVPSAWTDNESNSRPAEYVGPDYLTTMVASDDFWPYTYGGDTPLTGTLSIPWSYTPNTDDEGAYISVSLDGGETWTNTQIVAASGGVPASGTFDVDLTDATELQVSITNTGVVAPAFGSFQFTSGGVGDTINNQYGYSDGVNQAPGAVGTKTADDSVGGAVIDGFTAEAAHFGISTHLTFHLYASFPSSAPGQTAWSTLAFIDSGGNDVEFTPTSAPEFPGSYGSLLTTGFSAVGDQGVWTWVFSGNVANIFIAGNGYNVGLS